MPEKKKSSQISQKRKKRVRQRNIRLAMLIGGIILTSVIVVFTFLYMYVNQTETDIVCNNVFVGQSDLSGMDKKKAVSELEAQLQEYKEQSVELQIGEKSVSVLWGDLGIGMKDIDAVAQKAVDYGKKGSLWKRFQDIRKTKKEKVVLEEQFLLDGEMAAAVLIAHAVPLEVRATDATITYSNNEFLITPELEGNRINIDESIKKIEKYLNDEWQYKDAALALAEEVEEPRVKASDLESIQDLMGSFWTNAGSGQRKNNLKRAAELLNGLIVMPGEEVSVEAMLKPFTLDNGYVEAGAYESGQIVQSIAGGVCQVSTTLYNALLYAEVEVTERLAHSMTVNYVKPSRDAAIAEGVKDLKFKNNYESPIYIQGYINDSNQLQFLVYGNDTRPSNRKVEYESEVTAKEAYKTKYVADSGSKLGAMQTQGSGIDKVTARLWKIVYEDGNEVSREVWNNSYYRSSDVTVKVGVQSDNAEAVKVVKNAINTQDRDKIKAAISEAEAIIEAASSTAEENSETDSQTEG